MTIMNMVQAINSALQQEMERNKNILLMGEDVGKNGGVFRVTEGLWQKFGDERVVDTPLAESGIVGTAIGLAVNGFKPVAEIQFDGFSLPALDQLFNQAAKIRNRSRGRFSCPIVVRIPYGGGIKALEHHSESPEVHFAHQPGLKVVIPSSPYEAKGLLISALRDPDPVIFLEPKRIYRSIKEEVPDESYTIPFEAKVIQEGNDLTVIAYGAMLKIAREAVEKLGRYSIEIIDLRSISPLDIDAIVNSVKKTGRAVVVHEAPKNFGVGAEIVAQINENCLLSLKAPVERVCGWDVNVPLPKLEKYYFPEADRIISSMEKVMNY
jgi:pyruvate dehydrogenase E1 component beta subunit